MQTSSQLKEPSQRKGPISAGNAAALGASAGVQISSPIDSSILALKNWVEERNYAGMEPFDILNSPLLRHRWTRSWPLGVVFVQFGKRYAGLALRRWLRVPESKNPKALGLFLSAYCDLARCGRHTDDTVAYLKSELKRLRSPNEHEYCWGYDWDHVSRAGRMPAFSPNAIVSPSFFAAATDRASQIRL